MSRESGLVTSKLMFEQYRICEGAVRYRTLEMYRNFAHCAVILTAPGGETRGEPLGIRDGRLDLTGVRLGDAIEITGNYDGPENLRRRKYRRYLLAVAIDDDCLVVEIYRTPARVFTAARAFRDAV